MILTIKTLHNQIKTHPFLLIHSQFLSLAASFSPLLYLGAPQVFLFAEGTEHPKTLPLQRPQKPPQAPQDKAPAAAPRLTSYRMGRDGMIPKGSRETGIFT